MARIKPRVMRPVALCVSSGATGLIVLAFLATAGCGDRRFPVEGKVVYEDGTPYSGGGVVVMETTVAGKMIMKRAPIGPDGTFRPAAGTSSGVLAGTYRVRLLPAADGDEFDEDHPPPLPYDKKFASFDTSGVEWVIGAGQGAERLEINVGPLPSRRGK
jgi:hypothetical protein